MATKYPRVRIDYSESERSAPKGRRTVEQFDEFMQSAARQESPSGGYTKIWPKIYIDGSAEPVMEMRIDADHALSEGRTFDEVIKRRISYNERQLEKNPNAPTAQFRRDMLPGWKKVRDALHQPRHKPKSRRVKPTVRTGRRELRSSIRRDK